MRSPNATGFIYLPDELFENIVDRLGNESLMQLSMTCRRLHFLVLPIVFARASIHDTNPRDNTCFYLHDPPAHILRALRLALFVQNIESLGIGFGTHANTLLPYARELYKLVSRLPSMTRFYLDFSYSGMPSPSTPDPGWQREVIRLLDLVVDSSCVLLSVAGGDTIPGVHASATRTQPRLIISPVGRQLRRLLRSFKRAIDFIIPPKLAHFNSRSHRHGLREFRALSATLFHPPFLKWTISTLQTNSQTLTAVSFKTDHTAASTWHGIFSNVTLPCLSKFEVTSDLVIERRIVEFNDLLSFLIRHPSIVDLDIRAITLPINRRQPQKLLPALQMLRADPWLIFWLLNREQPFEYLTSLDMVSEVYPLFLPFDYDTFDDALGRVPCGAPHVSTLHISFYPEAGVTAWLDKQISQETSPLTALEGMTTLNLFQSWNMWRDEVRALIPQFLARFPGLQHLTYPRPQVEVDSAEFIREIMSACPGMKTVTIELGYPIDLDPLRNQY